MGRAAALLLSIGLTLAAWGAVSCYRGDPPCTPATVDWPRCDPTAPTLARDGGADR